MPELLSKNPILRRKIDLPEKFGQMNTLYFPEFSGKICRFRTKQLGTAPYQTSISPSSTQYWNGKEEFIGNPNIFWGGGIDALGFHCPRWSEISPKSLWNDKFDQIFADFARKCIV